MAPDSVRLALQSLVQTNTAYSPHMDNQHVESSRVSRWKDKFKNFNILKKEYLSLLVSWAQEMGCTQNNKLISNCLDFIDSKAQVVSLISAQISFIIFPPFITTWLIILRKLMTPMALSILITSTLPSFPFPVTKRGRHLIIFLLIMHLTVAMKGLRASLRIFVIL